MPAKKRAARAAQLSLDATRPKKPATPTKKTPRPPAAAKRVRATRADEGRQLADAVQALERLAESLHYTHESFAQSLLRLPRADEYEPLTEPLQRLVAATPALLRSLEAAPLRPEAAPSQVAAPLAAGNALVLSAVTAARDQLLAALEGLPQRADYEPAARNLRELASVSPSLLDWLSEVPVLAAPLVDSVAGLRAALAQLERALELLEEPPEAPGPRQAQMGEAGSRVKVVVRG